MGHAPKFKDAIDKIDANSNEGEQNYEIVFYQWGRVINLVFFQITVLEERGRESLEADECEDISEFDCFVNKYEDLDNYESYASAITTVSKLVPQQIFDQDNNLTKGEIWSSVITIASGLGIAFVLDMHRKSIDLNPNVAFERMSKFEGNMDLVSLIKQTEDLKLSVGDHNANRADSFRDAYDVLKGFKDGIAGVTGSDSKYYMCNTNITVAEDVYWYNGY